MTSQSEEGTCICTGGSGANGLKTVHSQQFKAMPGSKLSRYRKGVPFLSRMVYKRVRGWTWGQRLPIQSFREYFTPLPLPASYLFLFSHQS